MAEQPTKPGLPSWQWAMGREWELMLALGTGRCWQGRLASSMPGGPSRSLLLESVAVGGPLGLRPRSVRYVRHSRPGRVGHLPMRSTAAAEPMHGSALDRLMDGSCHRFPLRFYPRRMMTALPLLLHDLPASFLDAYPPDLQEACTTCIGARRRVVESRRDGAMRSISRKAKHAEP